MYKEESLNNLKFYNCNCGCDSWLMLCNAICDLEKCYMSLFRILVIWESNVWMWSLMKKRQYDYVEAYMKFWFVRSLSIRRKKVFRRKNKKNDGYDGYAYVSISDFLQWNLHLSYQIDANVCFV